MNNNELALVSPEDLSLVKDNTLNELQLQQILKRTPPQYVKKRPAKGGGQWEYVSGGYVKKCLNIMFGWDWDFEILEQIIQDGEAIVKGKLTCRTNGKTIVKMQFGNKDIIYKKQTEEQLKHGYPRVALSIGNDLKAAATDCLKKCAAEIGIAADIYNKEDFKEVQVDTENTIESTLKQLYDLKKEILPPDEQINFERIISQKETKSYKKAIKYLSGYEYYRKFK
ncbi:MAG: hypothetical protein EKK64_07945 [Neisseriaceae bacterium]|nr:MAG: hypothetical protein EKK64_07945 [Neisseriaceae bacterium]